MVTLKFVSIITLTGSIKIGVKCCSLSSRGGEVKQEKNV